MNTNLTQTIRSIKDSNRLITHLSDSELFAKILGSPLSVAEEVMQTYSGNLKNIAESSKRKMKEIKGIGETRYERIAAAFELGKRLARVHVEKPKITSPTDVADILMSRMRYLKQEVVIALCLDTKGGVDSLAKSLDYEGKLLGESQIFEGTLNASVFHPREILKFAIENTANSIILAHNHPSGDPKPSQEDIRATKQLIEAGNIVGIKVLDHIIIGDGIFVSLKEENFI